MASTVPWKLGSAEGVTGVGKGKPTAGGAGLYEGPHRRVRRCCPEDSVAFSLRFGLTQLRPVLWRGPPPAAGRGVAGGAAAGGGRAGSVARLRGATARGTGTGAEV